MAVYTVSKNIQGERACQGPHRRNPHSGIEFFLSILQYGDHFKTQTENTHLIEAQHGAERKTDKDQPAPAIIPNILTKVEDGRTIVDYKYKIIVGDIYQKGAE